MTSVVGAVLAAGSYSITSGKSAIIRLKLTHAGLKAFVNARARPLKEKLSVALGGRQVQTEMVVIS